MRRDHAPAATTSRDAQGKTRHAGGKSARWRVSAEFLQREVLVAWFVLKHRNTPWYVRIIAGNVATYVLSPIQIIPSFIPFIGLMDDVLVLTLGMGLIRLLVPATLLQEARWRAAVGMERGERIRPLTLHRDCGSLLAGFDHQSFLAIART